LKSSYFFNRLIVHNLVKIVNDKLIWNDENDKRKGYNPKDGSNLLKTGLVHEVTARAGRKITKKSNKEDYQIKGKLNSLF